MKTPCFEVQFESSELESTTRPHEANSSCRSEAEKMLQDYPLLSNRTELRDDRTYISSFKSPLFTLMDAGLSVQPLPLTRPLHLPSSLRLITGPISRHEAEAFPSSLPDPPHIKKRHKLTWKERFLVLKEASRLYAASWVRDIGPELRPNDYKKEESKDESNEEKGAKKERVPSTLEDLAVAARGGMETLRPALQRVIKKVYNKSWRRRKILNLNLERTLQKDLNDVFGTWFHWTHRKHIHCIHRW
ncbi:Hypothetical predicted protein [Olea europaea subsp. europaea]|uniref:Uncharacterized protein n=1 Tax=Olea europaea subsp. europaea TaxID=158383 RepID=A0A8S0QM62_OLEEU|nr:Hypothetical predicted protein [Olea europaea subsp. europaea]